MVIDGPPNLPPELLPLVVGGLQTLVVAVLGWLIKRSHDAAAAATEMVREYYGSIQEQLRLCREENAALRKRNAELLEQYLVARYGASNGGE